MSYPTSTFQRSDSQSGLYAHTQHQGFSANPGQQNPQNPQNPPSRPRFESRSSSDLTTTPSALSGFYADDSEYDWEGQALESAKESIGQIRAKIRSIGESQEVDIDGTIALFEKIKKAQTQRDLSLVRENDSALIETLSDPLYKLIKKLNSDLQSDKKLVASFSAEDIHVLFNGLSAIVGESVSDSLLSKQHFNKLRQPLCQITETMLVHALDQGLMQKHWDSSSLINACNWISRGLKNTILSAKSAVLKKGFTQALLMMKDWTSSAGQTATTLIDPLDTRQLGKCMVQVSTALNYDLVAEEAPEHLLRDLVLGLCGGNALAQCTLWRQSTDSNQSGRVLTVVLPGGAEITNISNTIKDCLQAGVLQLGDDQVQLVINSLCKHMNAISEGNLMERNGQRLGNCSNFLREIFECEHEAAQTVLRDRVEYEKACRRLLDQILKGSPVMLLSGQSIANLFSFVKAMDRARHQPKELLRSAAACLMTHVRAATKEMKTVESIAATLGGLHHLVQRGLIMPGPAVDLMLGLINEIALNDLAEWPVKSRVALMSAAVHCSRDLATRKTPLPQHHLLALMRELLALPDKIKEKYSYLMAASLLIKADDGWLANHQVILGKLLPTESDAPITEEDVLRELVQLRSSEAVVEKLPDHQIQPSPEQKDQSKPIAKAATTMAEYASVVMTTTQRIPVETTPVILPVTAYADQTSAATAKKNNAATTNSVVATPASKAIDTTDSVSSASIKPLVSRSTADPTNEYRTPRRVARLKRDQIAALPSTNPVLKVRDSPYPVRVDPPNNNPMEEKTAANKKMPSTVPKNPIKSATKETVVNKPATQTPEQMYFQLLKQEGALSPLQLTCMQELQSKTPSLAESVDGKGSKARTAMFYALSTGKPEAVRLILFKRKK